MAASRFRQCHRRPPGPCPPPGPAPPGPSREGADPDDGHRSPWAAALRPLSSIPARTPSALVSRSRQRLSPARSYSSRPISPSPSAPGRESAGVPGAPGRPSRSFRISDRVSSPSPFASTRTKQRFRTAENSARVTFPSPFRSYTFQPPSAPDGRWPAPAPPRPPRGGPSRPSGPPISVAQAARHRLNVTTAARFASGLPVVILAAPRATAP
jgi:hypothetical protein